MPSSPVIPFDDPTILFTNAGMNQFKDVFTGKRKAEYPRATTVQKCIRAGGKHNDLDNVGFTARHHTFFEMLGNFSFGDYFKQAAIEYAWEWVTREMGLPTDRLYATVYETDDEAFELWGKIAPELKNGRVRRFGKKDNYWSMGQVGPCGPCSEIHFDRGEKFGTGPQDVLNGETDRFMEIWNLVFMQDEVTPRGERIPLPNPSVDTGAGLERIASILQNCESNYGIDLFQGIIAAVSELTGAKYADHVVSHHVIADHIRALTFSIADGAGISNEGRGYVLRRILRRAARHGRELGASEPFMYKLVPVVVAQMGQTYPEIGQKAEHIQNVIRAEEESFGRTLETGLELFSNIAKRVRASGQTVVPGEEVFRLYDTYGFPYDLTEIIAAEQKLSLDHDGFEAAMEKQKELSRAASTFSTNEQENVRQAVGRLETAGLSAQPTTRFVREALKVEATLLLSDAVASPEIAVVLDRTPFYVEAGGQSGDTGLIYNRTFTMEVSSVVNHLDYYVHFGKLTHGTAKDLEISPEVTAEVHIERRWDIMRNHTATHLAHAALRRVLGDHVKQSGSYVGPDRLRFDFSHHQPMTAEEISEVERIVNAEILKASPVNTREMEAEAAKATGAMALFGEKYGARVRVVSVDDFSMELCGGTHVANVAQIGPFFITLETGVASGIRRLEAVTGRAAQALMLEQKKFRLDVSKLVGRPEAEALKGVEQLKENNNALQKELKKVRTDLVAGKGQAVGEEVKIGSLTLWYHDFGETDRDTMAAWADSKKEQVGPVVVLARGLANGKPAVMIAASSKAIKEHKVHAGNLAKTLLSRFGGRGGGKPNFAQGGVAESADFEAVVRELTGLLRENAGD